MTVEAHSGIGAFYRGRNERVEFIDVPEFGYVMIEGQGAPGSRGFETALAAVLAVSGAARFLTETDRGVSTRLMPPEAAFWVEGSSPWALGTTTRSEWRWKVMAMQPDPIDATIVERAVVHARARGTHGLDRLTYARWTEGPAAQTVRIGPYRTDDPGLNLLHAAIKDADRQPRLWHHEIYFGDPRRTAPGQLRTLIRQPITSVDDPG